MSADATAPRTIAVLPRGEAIRNFAYGRCLPALAEQTNLTVLSIVPDEATGAELAARFERLVPLAEPDGSQRASRASGALQHLLDLAHQRWLGSEGARMNRERKRRSATVPRLERAKRTVRDASSVVLANRPALEAMTRLQRRLIQRTTSPAERAGADLLAGSRPDLVFNASHIHNRAATPVIRAARKLGIPTAAFVFSWDNLMTRGRMVEPYDWYFVWNERMREQLLSIYRDVRPEQVFVTGTPQFDFHFDPCLQMSRERFCAEVGADPTRPIVLYTTGTEKLQPKEELIVARLAESLREMDGAPQLLVRVYPKDASGRFEPLRQTHPDLVMPAIDWVRSDRVQWLTPTLTDARLWTNMLRHAAVGINIASTVTLELCMLDRPAINIAFNPPGVDIAPVDYRRYYSFDHYRPVTESGAVAIVHSFPDLVAGVRAALRAPERRARERKALTTHFFGVPPDGRAGERIAALLASLASAQRSAVL